MDASGKLHDWDKAIQMIKDKLPLDNISHELLFDVVQWYMYDLDHPGMSIGYKLFKEKCVRFMGGYKNQGDGRIYGTNYTH